MIMDIFSRLALDIFPHIVGENVGLCLDLVVLLAYEKLDDGHKIGIVAAEAVAGEDVVRAFAVIIIYVRGSETATDGKPVLLGKLRGELKHHDSVHFVGIRGDKKRGSADNDSGLCVTEFENLRNVLHLHIVVEFLGKGFVYELSDCIEFFV